MTLNKLKLRIVKSSTARSLIAMCLYILVIRGHLFSDISTAYSLWVLIVFILIYYILKCVVRSLYALVKKQWRLLAQQSLDAIGCLSVFFIGIMLHTLITIILISSSGFCKNDISILANDFKLCEETKIFGVSYYLLKDEDYTAHLSENDILLKARINDWAESLKNEKSDGHSVFRGFECQNWDPRRIGGGFIEISEKCG